MLLELLIAITIDWQMLQGAETDELVMIGAYNPVVIAASLLVFYGFSQMRNVGKCPISAGIPFYIYLFHAGVLDFAEKAFSVVMGKSVFEVFAAPYGIPLITAFVFVMSLRASKAYLWIWKKSGCERRIGGWVAKTLGEKQGRDIAQP